MDDADLWPRLGRPLLDLVDHLVVLQADRDGRVRLAATDALLELTKRHEQSDGGGAQRLDDLEPRNGAHGD